jgi:hypothetical protein
MHTPKHSEELACFPSRSAFAMWGGKSSLTTCFENSKFKQQKISLKTKMPKSATAF